MNFETDESTTICLSKYRALKQKYKKLHTKFCDYKDRSRKFEAFIRELAKDDASICRQLKKYGITLLIGGNSSSNSKINMNRRQSMIYSNPKKIVENIARASSTKNKHNQTSSAPFEYPINIENKDVNIADSLKYMANKFTANQKNNGRKDGWSFIDNRKQHITYNFNDNSSNSSPINIHFITNGNICTDHRNSCGNTWQQKQRNVFDHGIQQMNVLRDRFQNLRRSSSVRMCEENKNECWSYDTPGESDNYTTPNNNRLSFTDPPAGFNREYLTVPCDRTSIGSDGDHCRSCGNHNQYGMNTHGYDYSPIFNRCESSSESDSNLDDNVVDLMRNRMDAQHGLPTIYSPKNTRKNISEVSDSTSDTSDDYIIPNINKNAGGILTIHESSTDRKIRLLEILEGLKTGKSDDVQHYEIKIVNLNTDMHASAAEVNEDHPPSNSNSMNLFYFFQNTQQLNSNKILVHTHDSINDLKWLIINDNEHLHLQNFNPMRLGVFHQHLNGIENSGEYSCYRNDLTLAECNIKHNDKIVVKLLHSRKRNKNSTANDAGFGMCSMERNRSVNIDCELQDENSRRMQYMTADVTSPTTSSVTLSPPPPILQAMEYRHHRQKTAVMDSQIFSPPSQTSSSSTKDSSSTKSFYASSDISSVTPSTFDSSMEADDKEMEISPALLQATAHTKVSLQVSQKNNLHLFRHRKIVSSKHFADEYAGYPISPMAAAAITTPDSYLQPRCQMPPQIRKNMNIEMNSFDDGSVAFANSKNHRRNNNIFFSKNNSDDYGSDSEIANGNKSTVSLHMKNISGSTEDEIILYSDEGVKE